MEKSIFKEEFEIKLVFNRDIFLPWQSNSLNIFGIFRRIKIERAWDCKRTHFKFWKSGTL